MAKDILEKLWKAQRRPEEDTDGVSLDLESEPEDPIDEEAGGFALPPQVRFAPLQQKPQAAGSVRPGPSERAAASARQLVAAQRKDRMAGYDARMRHGIASALLQREAPEEAHGPSAVDAFKAQYALGKDSDTEGRHDNDLSALGNLLGMDFSGMTPEGAARISSVLGLREKGVQAAKHATAAAIAARAKEDRDNTFTTERDKTQNVAAMERAEVTAGQRTAAQIQAEKRAVDIAIEAEKRRVAAKKEEEDRAKETKIGDERRHGAVEGRPFANPDIPPTPDQKKKVLEADDAAAQIDTALARVSAILAAHPGGMERMTPAVKEQIQSAMQIAQDQYRNLGNLGVPSGKDMELTARAAQDPTDFWNAVLGKGPASIAELQLSAKRIADNTARINAYGPRGQSGAKRAPPAGKVRISKKGETDKFVPRAVLEEAKKEGWMEAPGG